MSKLPRTVNAEIQTTDILDQLTVGEVMDFYGYEAFLDEIGVDEIKAYFGLIEEQS